MRKGELTTYAQKMRQANREAKATVVAFFVIVATWLVGGMGLSGIDVTVFGTPLWAVVGTLGTWAVAIVCAVVLSRHVFRDFSFEDESDASGDDASAEKARDERAYAAGQGSDSDASREPVAEENSAVSSTQAGTSDARSTAVSSDGDRRA